MPKFNMRRRSMSANFGVVNSMKSFLLILSDDGENGIDL
jgi:hypothetical protein